MHLHLAIALPLALTFMPAKGPKPSSSSACVGCMSEDTHANRVCSNRVSEPKTATGYFTVSGSNRKEFIDVGSPSSVRSVPALKSQFASFLPGRSLVKIPN